MCGILGQINRGENVDRKSFEMMLDTMAHRGPDGRGTYFSADYKIALGHRRLALIDLSEKGQQPIYNEDKTIWLTVNGEIYNSPELKKILRQKGHSFYSETDSEVIIHGYEEWGTNVLNKLKGMFAFGLWDEKKQQLFLARDRFGIKPLYYYSDENHFIFSSEIKGIIKNVEIKKEIDYSSFCDYFVYRYIPSPKTIWKNIFKLPSAHYLLLGKDNIIQTNEYWELNSGNDSYSEEEAISKVNDLLLKSVKEHTLSDLPVGSFLSGGYDSSAIVYYLNKMNYQTSTFSIGFENWNKSEHCFAEIVAKQFSTNHTSKIIGDSELLLLEKLVYHYDEPIADISIIPTYIVSEVACKKLKAVLSGEGADEIFSGYTWHKQPATKNNLLNIFKKKSLFTVEQYANAMAMGLFTRKELKGLLCHDLHKNIPEDPYWFYRKHFKPEFTDVKRFQYLDIKTFMGELVLTKVDRASMANSLEVRVPFLDHELVEFMFHLPESTYIREDYKKYLLYKNIDKALPQSILQRPKQGFVGPDAYYQNIKWYRNNLSESKLISDRIINKEYTDNLLKECDHWRLWKIVVMEKWYRQWVS
ncbi:MAG: asparagine synthase (glutamine-hydrolyzing) [Bacteroidota bacterium]